MQTRSVMSIYRQKVRTIERKLPHGVATFDSALNQAKKTASSTTPSSGTNNAREQQPEKKLIPVIFNPDALKNFKPRAAEALTAESILASYRLDPESEALSKSIIDFALQFQGTPYVWGGEDLENGTDCSGYMQSVFKQFDIELPRTAYYQSEEGQEIPLESIQPGDLLFFKTADYAPVTHVGLYIGDDKFVHASSKIGSVAISDLSSRWERKVVTVKRFT